MATALAGAIDGAEASAEFIAHDVSAERLEQFGAGLRRFTTAASNREVADRSDVTFLSVKPQIMPDVLPELADATGLFVSIAAGIRLRALEQALPQARVIRVMPNTPGLVGEMAAGYAAGTRATTEDAELVGRLLQSAGTAYELPEELLDAVTGLSGSGPAFVARLIEAFTLAGEAEGLPHETAYQLALATFRGTARLLQEKHLSPDELVTMVSSPGGTTIAGRRVLESSAYRDVIRRSVATAAERSRELGT